ncbi:hypothetical protein QCE63_28010 [Caballeronia sp. LZ065]|uniref:hypothetical protein n=1 Tax=Caballeronia sp. LZ065 TaxID=3038571 RepID=UPI002861F095|nr:hypothetical protein [Caballeronia sp. LZ065]MDR5783259.1 hypothetical protein [Caballeronia sp. LZ065]
MSNQNRADSTTSNDSAATVNKNRFSAVGPDIAASRDAELAGKLLTTTPSEHQIDVDVLFASEARG